MLYVTLASCAFLAGWLVYRYDMYEHEPWYMVLFAVGLGYGVMFLIGHFEVEDHLMKLAGDVPLAMAMAGSAALVEENCRLILVLALAIFIPSQFNDPMDGIIYGSLIGLGMALEESIGYLKHADLYPDHLPPTEVIRLLGHLLMGGITGFAVGMFRMRMKGWLRALAGCIVFSIVMHFFWDLIAFSTRAQGHSSPLVKLGTICMILGGMMFFGFLVVLASEWSRLVFAPERPHRLWGWPFSLWFGRDRSSGTGSS